MTAPRYLYLARHAEASADDLTPAGRRQAELLGERLRAVPLAAVRHGPLPRAAQTARLVAERFDAGRLQRVACEVSDAAGDYVPYMPERAELPADAADALLDFLAGVPAEERASGGVVAEAALELFTGPVEGAEPRHELVVTHAFLVGWLVRAALDAPRWRWLGINAANAALTVIRYAPAQPPAVLAFNDTTHLPPELRWTGFPAEYRVP